MKSNSFTLYKDLIVRYKREILKNFKDKICAISVFGSVARDQARDDSDIDMLIIVSGNKEKIRAKKISQIDLKVNDWGEFKALMRKGIHTKIFGILKREDELRENPLILLDILDHGKVLYDPRSIMKKILYDFEKKLKELRTKKILFSDGKWCWDLKPDWRPGEIVEIKL